MNLKSLKIIISIVALLLIVVAVGYFVFIKNQYQSSNSSKDSRFVPSGYGWIAGCVNVQFSENIGREEVKSLFQELGLKAPKSLFEGIKPYGAFVPTVEVIVHDFNQTATLLKKDSSVADIQLHYGPDPNGNYFVYVLFVDSMTLDRAYQLLDETYNLRVNGNRNYPGIKDTILTLAVTPESENSIVKNLQSSSIVQDALQCPVSPPGQPLKLLKFFASPFILPA